MKRIVRIVIKSGSGYGPYEEAYDDKIMITASGIQYEYKPLCLEVNQPLKWSFRTNSQSFKDAWLELCQVMPAVLAEDIVMVCDGREMTFAVTYEDKSRTVKTFWSPSGDPFDVCIRIIRKMLPGSEKIPEALWLPEDEEDLE